MREIKDSSLSLDGQNVHQIMINDLACLRQIGDFIHHINDAMSGLKDS